VTIFHGHRLLSVARLCFGFAGSVGPQAQRSFAQAFLHQAVDTDFLSSAAKTLLGRARGDTAAYSRGESHRGSSRSLLVGRWALVEKIAWTGKAGSASLLLAEHNSCALKKWQL